MHACMYTPLLLTAASGTLATDYLLANTKVNAVFEMVIKNAAGKEQSWTLDMKAGTVTLGKPEGKSDITISVVTSLSRRLKCDRLTKLLQTLRLGS